MKTRTLLATVATIGLLSGCLEDNSGSGKEQKATMQLSAQAATVAGMPGVVNFTEKRQLKMIYELRDTAKLTTYTYTTDLAGKLHSVCPGPSLGFPIPYATQYTAPKAPRAGYPLYPDGQTSSTTRFYDADQPEPNGLYMPTSAEGTWVICVDPNTKEPAPTYVEDRVRAYTFKMPSVD
ncbi:MAG: hypothetical protein ACHQU0_03430 [Candidatus Paceibacteria bacterium]